MPSWRRRCARRSWGRARLYRHLGLHSGQRLQQNQLSYLPMFCLCSAGCRSWCALVRFARRAAARGALVEAGTEPWAVRTLGPFAAARPVTSLRRRQSPSRATPRAASSGLCHLPLAGMDREGPALNVDTAWCALPNPLFVIPAVAKHCRRQKAGTPLFFPRCARIEEPGSPLSRGRRMGIGWTKPDGRTRRCFDWRLPAPATSS